MRQSVFQGSLTSEDIYYPGCLFSMIRGIDVSNMEDLWSIDALYASGQAA